MIFQLWDVKTREFHIRRAAGKLEPKELFPRDMEAKAKLRKDGLQTPTETKPSTNPSSPPRGAGPPQISYSTSMYPTSDARTSVEDPPQSNNGEAGQAPYGQLYPVPASGPGPAPPPPAPQLDFGDLSQLFGVPLDFDVGTFYDPMFLFQPVDNNEQYMSPQWPGSYTG